MKTCLACEGPATYTEFNEYVATTECDSPECLFRVVVFLVSGEEGERELKVYGDLLPLKPPETEG